MLHDTLDTVASASYVFHTVS